MGKSQRNKGKRGQLAFKNVLQDRDWRVLETQCGSENEDFWAIDAAGKTWSIEVKNQKSINVPIFRKQAMEQAKKSRLPWLLAAKIDGTQHWLIMMQNDKPKVW